MTKHKDENKLSEQELARYYANFVRENRIEPDVPTLNNYIREHGHEDRISKKSWSHIREIAFENNSDLQDMAFNESYFTDEYFDKLEEVLKNKKKFIVTTAVTGKAVKIDFYKTLQNWAKQNDAAILALPSADIKNSSTVFKMNFDPLLKNEDTWVILNRDHGDSSTISADETPDGYYLNKHLWLSCVKTQAKAVNPISGWEETITSKDASIIVGSPRQHLKYNAAMKCKTPKAVMTTGACTVNNYKTDLGMSAKISSKAKEAHQFAAVIVEVENEDIFHFRQIQSLDGSTFTDLYAKYTPDGNVTLAKNSTLIMGDSHAGATDKALLRDILNKLVSYGSIDEIVLHDLCDSRPVSPHDVGKIMTNADKVRRDKYLLKQNFEEIAEYLNIITAIGVRVVVVASNHDEHLNKAMENLPQWLKDSPNSEVLLRMASFFISNQRESLLQFCVENIPDTKLERPDLITWLKTDESYERYGCEIGQHGHLGINGSRGSLKQYKKAVGNAVIGHSHSAGIDGKVFQVGTTSELDQGYNKGLSSWTRTCCLLHQDGTKQLINFIPDGKGGYNFHI